MPEEVNRVAGPSFQPTTPSE